MGAMSADNSDEANIRAIINANVRPWDSFWYWRDKPVGEVGAAKEILQHAGIEMTDLVSRGNQDPPDCEGKLDGLWSAIEVTELVHQPTLERSIKAQLQRAAGREPEEPEAYFAWQRNDLIAAIQERIDTKDAVTLKGGPYERYVLVMHTDELVLTSEAVGQFLQGATFNCHHITDAILGLSPDGKGHPTFRLVLAGKIGEH